MAKHRVVALKDVKTNFFVRKGIDQDHVLMLAELYESALLENKGDQVQASKAIAAIEVTSDLVMVDGRHRKEAMELAGITEARVEDVGSLTDAEIIVRASRANYGGSLPPTREDMIYTVEQMITRMGMSAATVEAHMTMIPKTVIRKYINMANKRINESKIKMALGDIASGMGLLQAARVHGLKAEALKLVIEGKKPKSKAGTAQLNSQLSTYAKTFGLQTTRVVNKALEDYKDGEIAFETAQTVVNHYGHLLRRMFLRVSDWDNRLKALKSGVDMGPDRPDKPEYIPQNITTGGKQ